MQLKFHTLEYFLLWAGFIAYVDHRTEAFGAAKKLMQTLLSLCLKMILALEVALILKRLMYQRLKGFRFSETSSIPALYSFQPSDTESDRSSDNSSDNSDHSRLPDLSW